MDVLLWSHFSFSLLLSPFSSIALLPVPLIPLLLSSSTDVRKSGMRNHGCYESSSWYKSVKPVENFPSELFLMENRVLDQTTIFMESYCFPQFFLIDVKPKIFLWKLNIFSGFGPKFTLFWPFWDKKLKFSAENFNKKPKQKPVCFYWNFLRE